MFLISIVVKSFAATFYKSKQTYLKISDRIKNMFNSFILQMIILVCHVLKNIKMIRTLLKSLRTSSLSMNDFTFERKSQYY